MPSLPPSVHTKRIEIRWRDMDAFRHVNNSVYLTYLEETRDEWFLAVLGNVDRGEDSRFTHQPSHAP